MFDYAFLAQKAENPHKSLSAIIDFIQNNVDEAHNLLKYFAENYFKLPVVKANEIKQKYEFGSTPKNKRIFEFLLPKVGLPNK